MSSVFPNFKTLELGDHELIEKFVGQFPPYNDFEFISLWTYNTENKNSISFLNNNLVVRIQDCITGNFFYSFLGANKTKNTIEALLKKSKEENLETKLYLVPEASLTSPDLYKHFSVKEDPDNFDYILSVNELADLKGKKYYDKRNLVNKFKRLYPQHSVVELDLAKEKTKQEIKEFFHLWEKQKGKKRNETQVELTAIEKLFDLINIFNVYGLGVYIQNKLVGFTTYHTVQNNFAIMSFEKGDISYEGIYSYLNHITAKHLKTLGANYINYEQDLGIPGLKKAKLLWRPVFFLKKYIIEEL